MNWWHLYRLRAAKVLTAVRHPACWKALSHGVVPTSEHLAVLRGLDCEGVLDVGANRGQFTLACSIAHAQWPVVAFEPIPAEAKLFRIVHAGRQNVTLVETAVGETDSVAALHISRSADSSSLLPIGIRQKQFFGKTQEVGIIDVKVQRLDDLQRLWLGRARQLLKIDVQGFELSVLRGAEETLRSCAYVYVECSEVILYEGQALRPEVQAYLEAQGFVLDKRYNEHRHKGQLIQADYLFARANAKPV